MDNVGRNIFPDTPCCSRAVGDPALQVPEKQVDTEERCNNCNNYDKTKRNGDDDHDDYNKKDEDLFLNSFPDLLPQFSTERDPWTKLELTLIDPEKARKFKVLTSPI